MGNPTCPNDNTPLVTKAFKTVFESLTKAGKNRVGTSNYWYCTKCKCRWKKGREIIGRK